MYISTLTIARKSNMTNKSVMTKCRSKQIGKPSVHKLKKSGIEIKIILVTYTEYKQHLHGYIQSIKASRKETIIPKSTRTKLSKLMVAFGVPTVFAPN